MQEDFEGILEREIDFNQTMERHLAWSYVYDHLLRKIKKTMKV